MKKGFTLIELLAVIVILAIIALIATPIVLNIINDARESSTLRSADFYLAAVEYTIADAVLNKGGITNGTYYIMPDGNLCKVELDDGVCPETDNKSNILEVEVNGEVPSSGTITIENGNIKDISVELNNKTIIKSETEGLKYYVSPCKVISGDKNTNGSKYECEVKPGVKYNFFVISQNEDGTTNLIMERNINNDGILAEKGISSLSPENGIYNLVAWISKKDYNDDVNYGDYGNHNKGPVTAMNYIYEATKDWSNIPNIVMDYEDENINLSTQQKGTNGYGGIKTENNITKIISKEGTETASYTNLKARLPRYDEVHGEGKCLTYAENGYKGGSCPLYLVNYLDSSEYATVNGFQNISKISGYWILSSGAHSSNFVWDVVGDGYVNNFTVGDDDIYGVRPVINLKL